MGKYEIEVRRDASSFRAAIYEADSLEEAEEKALDEAGDHLYRSEVAEYFIDGSREVSADSVVTSGLG